jgi:hypothetical protein
MSDQIFVYDQSGAVSWGNITVTDSTATNGGYSNVARIVVNSPTGTVTTVEKPLHDKPDIAKRISPKLYFSFVKSKLQKNEIKALKVRLAKLQTFTKDAFDLQQQSLYEEYAKQMAITVRESEAYACGFDQWVMIQDLEKFRSITKEPGADSSPVFFKKLEDFPRTLPYKTKVEVQKIKERKIFDQLWVLYLDYTKTELKTNKEKIREKDPILFGQFAYQKDKYYYLLDWIDEHCDLTLSKFIDKMSADDPTYKIKKIPEIDCDWVEQIKKEVMDRERRMTEVRPSNYRDLMTQEDQANARNKKPWYKRLFAWWKKVLKV